MNKYINIFIALLLCCTAMCGQSYANMPALTDLPSPKTAQACFDWAKNQDEDAHHMWGVRDNATNNVELGKLRISIYCLIGEKPEIVGFGSSVGFDRNYCRNHKAQKICSKQK